MKATFLLLLVVLTACGIKNKQEKEAAELSEKSSTITLYLGTYTGEGSHGIYQAVFDDKTGELSGLQTSAKLKNPSFQSTDQDGNFLLSINEIGQRKGMVMIYRINAEQGQLTALDSFSTQGSGPCYVSFDDKNQVVLAANYVSGNVIAVPIDKDGKVSSASSVYQHEGTGPVGDRQEGPHAHSVIPGPSGKYIYSADLGADKIYVYTITDGQLTLYREIITAPGHGPRHMAFHPSKKAMAVINELSNSVSVYTPDETGCFSVLLATYPTLPDEFKEFNKGADIHYSPDGNWLFASNRGHNSIVSFKIDSESMELELAAFSKENIDWTRNFAVSPSGRHLLAANRNGNNITVYRIDQQSGELHYTGNSLALSQPVCITMLP